MSGNNIPMDEHRFEAVIENVQFLMSMGDQFEVACRRVGRTPDSVEKLFERHGHPNPANKTKEMSA